YSIDGGAIWNLAAQPPGGYRSAVAFFGADTLLTVGTGGEDSSADRGAHWMRTGDIDLNAIAVLDGSHAWAVGPEGTVVRWVPAR
ncbi:MAG TPA: photosystem II stability/assembly factor-like protein, partial [archaeon]|nr:photosystem II stability/assembly factor-like protein [archaeon]